ncbi:MAG: cupin domain-containing protein [Sphaerochaetaceae bacterium]|jgi:uncharacterized cupin superfamily protein|nr:cupin domain-containing protein [Sphaerochaetaceae bacterium]
MARCRLQGHCCSHPYHWHEKSEEVFVILHGSALLRTPEGITRVKEADIAVFPTGPEGAHQLYNDGDADLEHLDLGTLEAGDICHYPDSGKTNDLDRGIIRKGNEIVSYYEGEDSPCWP